MDRVHLVPSAGGDDSEMIPTCGTLKKILEHSLTEARRFLRGLRVIQ